MIAGLLIAPRWNRTACLHGRRVHHAEIRRRVQKFYTALFLSVSLFSTGTFLYSIARIVETAVGISFITSIQVLGLLCILYVAIGGFRAVVVTDVLQFLILTAAVVIVLPLAFERIGGTDTLFRQTPEGFFRPCGRGNIRGVSCSPRCSATPPRWAATGPSSSVTRASPPPPQPAKRGAVRRPLPGMPRRLDAAAVLFRLHEPSLTGFGSENAYLLMCREVRHRDCSG